MGDDQNGITAPPKPTPKGLIPWKKGQSGNPKGRPKNTWREEVYRLLAMPNGKSRQDYQTTILKQLRDAAASGDLKAIAMLAEMVPGALAPRQVEVEGEGTQVNFVLAKDVVLAPHQNGSGKLSLSELLNEGRDEDSGSPRALPPVRGNGSEPEKQDKEPDSPPPTTET